MAGNTSTVCEVTFKKWAFILSVVANIYDELVIKMSGGDQPFSQDHYVQSKCPVCTVMLQANF